jgi:hypothetical protein
MYGNEVEDLTNLFRHRDDDADNNANDAEHDEANDELHL